MPGCCSRPTIPLPGHRRWSACCRIPLCALSTPLVAKPARLSSRGKKPLGKRLRYIDRFDRQRMRPRWPSPIWRLRAARLAALLAVVAITLYVYAIRDQADQLVAYGYPGIMLLSLLANATVILPAPGIAVVFAMGATGVFSPIGIALAAGLGATIGELSGYLAGFSGRALIENRRAYERLNDWMRSKGVVTVLVLAALPNPFFDLAGISAGTLRMPLPRFLLACFAGKVIKMLFFAYAGAQFASTLGS